MKKIYENEKRLQAGDHSLDLLAHDFEKNYNMYIFPVHWQFGQLDQHPVDGYAGQNKDEKDKMLFIYNTIAKRSPIRHRPPLS